MRAFLSHSSADKAFVRQVATMLGLAQCEYDEESFEHTLNVKAIHDALTRSDMFVYFLSAKSLSSFFVKEETRTALEQRGAGLIRKIMIFTLDDTSYKTLPDWLKQINVVQRLSSYKQCARKIQSALLRLEAESDSGFEIYIGRTEEDAALLKALSGAPATTPIAIHAVGHYGVGRKTYLRQNLKKFFPRRVETFPEISISSNEGIEELYRNLYDLAYGRSLENTIQDIKRFSTLDHRSQIEEVANIVNSLMKAGEFLLATDDGGVYNDEGDYQSYLHEVLQKVDGNGLPVIGFVQTRMMPGRIKAKHNRSFHQYITTLSDSNARELFGLLLKQLGVDYTDEQLTECSTHLDGHPFNIKFAAALSHDYGIDLLISDPIDLVEWKRKRAEDFLRGMSFSNEEIDIIVALDEYRYLATDMLWSVLDSKLDVSAAALRRLMEFSCVERREGYCHIAPPLRDGIRRDARFQRSDAWRQNLGKKICEAIKDYTNEDDISVAILDRGALAAARGNAAPAFLSALILPSHLLRIARDYYEDKKRGRCIEFCEKAWLVRNRLSDEAQLEVLRLWGLSAVWINSEETYEQVIANFRHFTGKSATRIRLFVEGMYFRLKKRADDAEARFLQAWRLSPDNASICRELAKLLAKQKRYDEAERFAEGAYQQQPTNPFLIDVMVEVLVGKVQLGQYVDRRKLNQVMDDLERYGDTPGSSFFLVRKAQSQLADRDYEGALITSNRAVDRTPGLVNAHFIRADARLALHDIVGAEQDVQEINKILTNAGGFSEGDEARVQELEIRILIERGLLTQAKEATVRAAWLPTRVAQRLERQIAKTISFNPSNVSDELRNWAKNYSAGSDQP